MTNKDTVYKITSKIPKGKVLTYGKLAKLSGIKSPRAVGNILHRNTDPASIPCHRVVSFNGGLAESYAFGGKEKQREKLLQEGVLFKNGKVDLETCLY